MRTRIKTASGTEERSILANVQRAAEDPAVLLPVCVHADAQRCHLRKIEAKLRKVVRYKEDERKLTKFSRRGHDLVRAYADSLILADQGRVRFLSRVKIADRMVPFAQRAKAPGLALAGVQHLDDPELRNLPLVADIKKKKLHVYSDDDGWWCTGTTPAPPAKFVNEQLARLKTVRDKGGGFHACPHLTTPNEGPARLHLRWGPAGVSVAICEACLGEENTAAKLMARIVSPAPLDEFTLEVTLPPPVCKGHKDACPAGSAYKAPIETRAYLDGKITDREILHLAHKAAEERLLKGPKLFFARDTCYGTDTEAFLSALRTAELERRALKGALERTDRPVVATEGTVGQVAAALWADHGRSILEAVAGPKLAEELYGRFDPARTPLNEILKEAERTAASTRLAEELPTYGPMPLPAQVADRIARAYRLEGVEATVRACEPGKGWDTKTKSIGYAFLLALGRGEGQAWRYIKEERELAEHLAPQARTLLDATAKEYHGALTMLMRDAGVTAEIVPKT